MKCQYCNGCGQVANDDDKTPWEYWENLPPGSNAAVVLGIVVPLICMRCNGTGETPQAPTEDQT